MTLSEAASTSDPASNPPKTATTVRLSFGNNARRIYATWWDIANTSIFLLAVFCGLIALALLFAGNSNIGVLGADVLTPERRLEISLSILGLSISAGSAVALWLLNKGVERWSIISRIYYLHRYIFKALGRSDGDSAQGIFSAYSTLSDGHFENVNVCHPMVQKYFEELRLLILTDRGLGSDHLRMEVAFRCFMISLMTKGFLRGSDLDDRLIATCRERASAVHGIETA